MNGKRRSLYLPFVSSELNHNFKEEGALPFLAFFSELTKMDKKCPNKTNIKSVLIMS